MPSGLTAAKLSSEVKVTQYDFDPNATTATAVGWVDMKDFSKLLVSFFRTVGTSNVTMTINGATTSAGANSTTIVSKTFSDGQPNAVGDYAFLECLAEQVRAVGDAAGYALRYVSAVITFATGTDEAVITYILGGAKFKYSALTADSIS